MIRKHLLLLLQDYQPTDEEKEAKERMIQFIQQHENCFERSLQKGHITASAWLLHKSSDKALLMHHTKLDKWFQLGGHCDGDPHVLQVALKEAQEESGISHIQAVSNEIFDIDIHLIPKNQKEPAHYHYDVRFLLQVMSEEQVQQNNESKELRWIDKYSPQLPTQERSVIRMFEKWHRITL